MFLLLLSLVTTYTDCPSSVCRSTTALTSPECPAVYSVERRYHTCSPSLVPLVLHVACKCRSRTITLDNASDPRHVSPAQITYKYEACLARSQFLEMSTNAIAISEQNSSPARSLFVALKPPRRIPDLPLLQHDELPPCEEVNRCRDYDELVTGH